MRRVLPAAIALCLLLAMPLAAQRAELAVLGGSVRSPDLEFDRVTSSTLGPPLYTRERGVREPGTSVAVTATFAIRGHIFGEIGLLHHGVERRISRTGTGDPDGPFLATTSAEGSIASVWMGPSYRFVDRERIAVSALGAPALFVMLGDAYSARVFSNAPSRRAEFGFVIGLRARYWLTERLGLQASLDDAIWRVPIAPHPSEGTTLYPEAYRNTPTQHDLRLQLGVALKLR